MPNHITNVLRVTGYQHRGAPAGLADEVLDLLRGPDSPVDFNRLIPMPEGYDKDQRWYDWSIANWGTKWNAYQAFVGKTDANEVMFHFETAWAPPLPVIDAIAAKFPKANIRLIWCDEGDDHQHRVYWEDGKREAEEAA